MKNQEFQPSTTLTTVKQFLRKNLNDGCICPACNQTVKMYKRKLSSTMAYCMIIFVKHCRKENEFGFVNFTKVLNNLNITPTQRADWQKLSYFKLIIPETTKKGDPKNGFYKVNASGFDFVENNLQVPESCNVYNGKVYGFSMEQTNIKKALTNKFNFDELMNN